MAGLKAKILGLFGYVSDINVCTDKEALIAFLQALKSGDTDKNGKLDVGELTKVFGKSAKNTIIRTSMTEEDTIAFVKSLFEE